jgi:hypothetical protein
MENPAEKLKKSYTKLYIILGVIVFIIYASFTGSQSGTGGLNPPDKMTAYFASQDFVEKNLKAPSTAKFPWYSEPFVTDLGGGRFRVSAYVDAQNTFGAQIRTQYTCVVKGTDEIHWILESLDI